MMDGAFNITECRLQHPFWVVGHTEMPVYDANAHHRDLGTFFHLHTGHDTGVEVVFLEQETTDLREG